jgi:hypothetical protein
MQVNSIIVAIVIKVLGQIAEDCLALASRFGKTLDDVMSVFMFKSTVF